MARTWISTGSPENRTATLTVQGQIRPIADHDAQMLLNHLIAAGAPA